MFSSIHKFFRYIVISLPPLAHKRLLVVSIGWLSVALAEAIAYTVLSFSILNNLSPFNVLVSATIAVLLTVLVSRQGYLTGVRLAGDLYQGLGTALASAKLSWLNQANRTKVASMAGKSIPQFMSIPAHQLQMFIHSPSLALFLIVSLGWLTEKTVAIWAFGLLFFSFALQWYGQFLLLRVDKNRNQLELLTNQSILNFVEHIELLRTSKGIDGAVQPLKNEWLRQSDSFSRINSIAALATGISLFASVLPTAGLIGYLWFAGVRIETQILAIIVLITRAAAPLEQLATATFSINDIKHLFSEYSQLYYIPSLNEPDNTVVSHTLSTYQTLEDRKKFEITIHQVNHSPILSNINLIIPYQTHLQITGKSGSGKSTLLELILRFDDPKEGYICLGGIRLSEFPYDELVKHIAYVPQEPIIFTGTLAENIRIGKPQATDEEIENVAKQVALTDLIQRSSDGIYYHVGRQGTALSGGERQRVALARAIIKNAPILIIDEGTSALDEGTEVEVVKNINKLNSTVIFVTHRLSDIWKTDKIYDLSNRTVVL